MTCLSLFVLLLTPAYSSDNTLHKAAGTSNPEEIKALISAGAKVNAKDENGLTPLAAALQLKPRCSKSSYQCRC